MTRLWSSFAGAKRGRLASSFLFAGPAGIGKRSFAIKLAQALLCENSPERSARSLRTLPGVHPSSCRNASRFSNGFQAGRQVVYSPGAFDRRQGASAPGRTLSSHCLEAFQGGRKIAVIDDADYLNAEGANALLKHLEEPPPRSVLILIGTSPAKQLPTIRSRCQLIRFQPLDAERDCPTAAGSRHRARRGRSAAFGTIQRGQHSAGGRTCRSGALDISRCAISAAGRGNARQRIACPNDAKFVEQAGKDAAPRRRRLHQAIGFAADFYQLLLRAQCKREGRRGRFAGSAATDLRAAADATCKSELSPDDAEVDRLIETVLKRQPLDVEKTLARLDLCLQAETADRSQRQSIDLDRNLAGRPGLNVKRSSRPGRWELKNSH